MIIDQSSVKLNNVKEIVRLSELYLAGTVQLALAADSRAISLTGMLVTSSGALIAAGFTLLFYQKDLLPINLVLGMGAFGSSLCLLGGAWQAISAAKPRQFSVGGNYLKSWDPEELYGNLIGPLLDQAGIYQGKIETNLSRLQIGSVYLQRALICVVLSPISGILFGLAGYFGFPLVSTLTGL